MTAPPNATYMLEALAFARRSRPSPNPRVGAVIVQDGNIVGRGFHERPGMPHAEIVALREAGEQAKGADLYVTLEPCCHVGRTGPCAEAIINAGIARVFVGMQDPDPRVNGNGIRWLRGQGIEVWNEIEQEACEELLIGYSHHRRSGRPLVTLKAAISLDGYLATTNGLSKWISSEVSRIRAHKMRADCDAVLAGVGTVLADDPALTVRLASGRSPARIVLDSRLRIPNASQLVQSAQQIPLLVVHGVDAPQQRIDELSKLGVRLMVSPPNESGRVDLPFLLDELGREGVLSLLVEGGAAVHGEFLKQRLAQRLTLFIAPRVFGSGIPWAMFENTTHVEDAIAVPEMTCQSLGHDLLLEGWLVDRKPREFLPVK